jgi:hypothetical protein
MTIVLGLAGLYLVGLACRWGLYCKHNRPRHRCYQKGC